MTYSDYFWFVRKKMPTLTYMLWVLYAIEWAISVFSHALLPSQTCRIPDETPPKMEVTVCGSFIHRTLCWIYLFSSDRLNYAASVVRARYSTNSNLNQGITKRPDIFIFAKFSYRQRNPPMKTFKTKKKYLYYLGNFNSPLSTSNVRLEPGIESNSIVCAFLFGSG